jgi:hypothetical protein
MTNFKASDTPNRGPDETSGHTRKGPANTRTSQ